MYPANNCVYEVTLETMEICTIPKMAVHFVDVVMERVYVKKNLPVKADLCIGLLYMQRG